MIFFSKVVVCLFGMFLISSGMLMMLVPSKVREIIGKAGSTNFINYSEITLRMIPAAAFIVCSDHSLFPGYFKIFGWFMIATSLILFCIPRKLHHDFSLKCAEFLKPVYLKIISPAAILFGVILIYCII